MAISPISNSPSPQPNTPVNDAASTTATEKAKKPYKDIDARADLNAQLVANLDVSISAGSQPQALLYRSAIDKINEILSASAAAATPTDGSTTVSKTPLQDAAANQDNSAEATAKRILAMTTSFYDAYAAQNKDKSPEDIAKGFVDVVRGGFEKGFNEAKDILKGLKVLEGDVASGIQKTYDLVQKGFDDFLAAKLAPKDSNTPPTTTTNTAPATTGSKSA